MKPAPSQTATRFRFKHFFAVLAARNTEFFRDRAALAWNILFPVLIVAGFAFAFSGDQIDLYKVGVYGEPSAQEKQQNSFLNTEHIQFIPVTELQPAIVRLERHQLDMLFDPETKRYWINEESPRGYLLERILRGTDAQSEFSKQSVTGKAIRYVDWLIPGVLAMNMMFSALFGIGYVIVRYRKNGVLKRLKATPLSALEFLTAQIASRLWLILAITTFVFAGTNLFVNFAMFGSWLNLFIIFTLGTISMISLGLLIAARLSSEELAGGLLNLISWPMIFLSGVWFSLEGSPPVIKQLAQLLPLTHLIDGARAIMIDGAGLIDIAPQLGILALMSAVFIAIGAASFRWE